MDHPLRVIAAVALTPRARAIAEVAAGVARLLDAELTLAYVGTPTADERQQLEQIVASLAGPCALVTRAGRPEKIIGQLAEELHADVIVLGALEQEDAVRDLLGSVARTTARNASCSVLLLPDPFHAKFDTIVVATGFDDRSAAMVNFTVDLASRAGTRKLHIVHEHQAEAGLARLATPNEEVSQYRQQRAEVDRHMLDNFLATFDLQGIDVRSKSLEGFEGSEAVRYADQWETDLLVVKAPEKRLGIWDWFFHHPIENVLQHLPCAVLLYRPLHSERAAR